MVIRQETVQFPFLMENARDTRRMGDIAAVRKGAGIDGVCPR